MSTGGIFLFRALEQQLPGVLQKRFRQLPFENGDVVPTIADLQVGAFELVRNTFDWIGDAQIVANGATDFPIVDVSAGEDRYKVFMFGSAFSYTFQDERAYQKGNFNVDDRKMQAARRAIAERHNFFAAYGETRLNVSGFLNNPAVTVDNSSFDPYSTATTPDQLVGFFVDQIQAVYRGSNNVEMPTDCLIPPAMHFLLIKRQMPYASTPIMDYIAQALTDSKIKFNIMKCNECESAKLERVGVQAAGTNKDRIVLYPKDPEVVERHIELTKMMPPDWVSVKEGRRVFPMFSCSTPTIVNYPRAMRYVDVAKG